MLNLIQTIAIRLRHREEGQTFVEYALLIGLVSLSLAAGFALLDEALGGLVADIAEELGVDLPVVGE